MQPANTVTMLGDFAGGQFVANALRHARELVTLYPGDAQFRALLSDLEQRQAR